MAQGNSSDRARRILIGLAMVLVLISALTPWFKVVPGWFFLCIALAFRWLADLI